MKTMFMVLLVILGITGLWDGFTTFYGSHSMLGDTGVSIIMSIIFAVIITAFLFTTSFIWSREIEDEFIGILLRGFWLIAFGYDIFTSFIGNKDIILPEAGSFSQLAMLVGITIMVSGSPIIFSYVVTLMSADEQKNNNSMY